MKWSQWIGRSFGGDNPDIPIWIQTKRELLRLIEKRGGYLWRRKRIERDERVRRRVGPLDLVGGAVLLSDPNRLPDERGITAGLLQAMRELTIGRCLDLFYFANIYG